MTTASDRDDALPMHTFDALALTPETRRAIDELGWVNPTPVQLATYEPAIARRDLIVQARTGTGKTGAFGIALVDRLLLDEPFVQALVLAPTRELALQSTKELAKLGKHRNIRTTAVYGGAPMERQVRELAQGAHIVSGTPGRVLDHLRRGTLDARRISVLVLDEADEMLSMGFAEELNAIVAKLPTERQTLLFSATVDRDIQRLALRYMRSPEHLSLSSDQVGATTLTHFVYMVGGRGRSQELVRILEVENPESAIIFCNMKSETEMVAAHLGQAGFDADWLNGDLPQSEREKVMERTRRGALRFLVATDVAARGIDISHLTHVINYTFPEAIEQYIHRTGRTGRAGRTGTAISLIGPSELGSLYFLRLQFKIFPVERSLPTRGEERTRAEADRIALLDAAFPAEPGDLDRAVARRLLLHPAAERVLGGLLGAFFGTRASDVDEEAAAARRSRPPRPIADRDRGPRDTTPAPPPEPSARPAEAVEARPEPEPRRPAPPEPDGSDAGRDRDRDRDAGRDRDRDRDAGRDRDRDRDADRDRDGGGDRDEPGTPGMTRLFMNVGRRDGMRAGDIARLLREAADLKRSDIGRIRVRDKHAFVEVIDEHVENVVRGLAGREVNDRELVIEPAKSGR